MGSYGIIWLSTGREEQMADIISQLSEQYGSLPAQDLLARAIKTEFPGRIALVSSFGAEAAILLHMVSEIDPSTPVLFLDTGKLFGETKKYRNQLIEKLGLEDVRSITPLPENEAALDPKGVLWASEPARCCYFRKVLPLQRALEGFDAWITGRKQYQSAERAGVPYFELADGRVKVNPLIGWEKTEVDAYFAAHDLPPHPLVAQGYPSIGCMPCTDRVTPDEDPRAGRWRGQAKTECGIHMSPNGLSRHPVSLPAPRTAGCG